MTNAATQRNRELIPLLFPILVGLVALASIEFSDVMGWLLVQPTVIVLSGLILLGGVVLLLSRSVANQADRVAELIGQPYGTLVLTAAVMTIELALVARAMLTGESNPTLARDSMFSVVMIALTGVTGLCNVLAAVRRGTLCADGKIDTSMMVGPNLLGALTYFDLIGTMCVLALVVQLQPQHHGSELQHAGECGVVGGGPGGLRRVPHRPDGALQQPVHRTREPDHREDDGLEPEGPCRCGRRGPGGGSAGGA